MLIKLLNCRPAKVRHDKNKKVLSKTGILSYSYFVLRKYVVVFHMGKQPESIQVTAAAVWG